MSSVFTCERVWVKLCCMWFVTSVNLQWFFDACLQTFVALNLILMHSCGCVSQLHPLSKKGYCQRSWMPLLLPPLICLYQSVSLNSVAVMLNHTHNQSAWAHVSGISICIARLNEYHCNPWLDVHRSCLCACVFEEVKKNVAHEPRFSCSYWQTFQKPPPDTLRSYCSASVLFPLMASFHILC